VDRDGEVLRERKVTICGVRHGKLYVHVEGEPLTRILRCKFKDLQWKANPQQATSSATAAASLASGVDRYYSKTHEWGSHFRYPTQRGGIGVFDASRGCGMFGVDPGQIVSYCIQDEKSSPLKRRRPKEETPKSTLRKEGVIIGVRRGVLWRIDREATEAKPFVGAKERASFLEQFHVELLGICPLTSHTW